MLRIGEVAERTGTTPRTIRYYEEIGLLGAGEARETGRHRLYGEADVARLREIVRLKDLLGLSLDELKALLEAEDARAAIRERFRATESPEERRRLLEQAKGHVADQLELVAGRRRELDALQRELEEKRSRLEARLRELGES